MKKKVIQRKYSNYVTCRFRSNLGELCVDSPIIFGRMIEPPTVMYCDIHFSGYLLFKDTNLLLDICPFTVVCMLLM